MSLCRVLHFIYCCAERHYAERHYAEWCYTERHILQIVALNDIMPSVTMLNAVMLSVVAPGLATVFILAEAAQNSRQIF